MAASLARTLAVSGWGQKLAKVLAKEASQTESVTLTDLII